MRTALASLALLLTPWSLAPGHTAPAAADRAAEVLPATSSRIDVVVPVDAGPGTVRAGLTAVGALAARYPTASIGLRADDTGVPEVAGDQRVVLLRPAAEPVRRSVSSVDGVPALVIEGRGPALLDAARALAGPDGGPAPRADIAVDLGTDGPSRTGHHDLVTAARRAAPVVTALQQTTSRVLPVRVLAPGSLVTGDRSGVLVGATAADAAAVGAPLRLRSDSGLPGLAPGTAYAALQPVVHDGRRLLLLGGWAPGGADGERHLDQLLDRAAYTAGTTAWDGRGGEALVVTAGADPLLTTVPTPDPAASVGVATPPTTRPVAGAEASGARPEDGTAGRWWFVGGVAALLVALTGRGLTTVARQRR